MSRHFRQSHGNCLIGLFLITSPRSQTEDFVDATTSLTVCLMSISLNSVGGWKKTNNRKQSARLTFAGEGDQIWWQKDWVRIIFKLRSQNCAIYLSHTHIQTYIHIYTYNKSNKSNFGQHQCWKTLWIRQRPMHQSEYLMKLLCHGLHFLENSHWSHI